MEERQTNYTIAEGYELPSKGLIYDKPISAHVELRSMTARDEMKRLAPSTTPLKTLADIIEGCMIEKPAIHVYDMCLGDYEYLLHKLRVITYGSNYPVTLRCPTCGEYVDATLDLDSLEVKKFDQEKFEELRVFTLPRSNKRIALHFQTPRMLDELELRKKEMARKYKSASIDFETLIKLSMAIESVDGIVYSPTEMETFINNLPAMDMQKILNNIDSLNSIIGLDTTFVIPCTTCGEDIASFFRFGTEFFRPSNI